MLMAMGLPVPRRLVVTGWWLTDNTKMSKSLGNVVDPLSLKDKYGPEVLRYFLLREMAVGQDSNFSEEALVRRNNADLANDLGNLVQRVIALCVKWFDGQVPEPPAHRQHSAALDGALNFARLLLGRATGDFGDVRPIIESVRDFRIHRTLADVMLLVSRLNQVLTADAPFHTVRTDKEAAALTLYSVLDGIRIAANLLEPVLPATSLEILRRIGWHGDVLTLDALDIGQLRPGVAVIEGAPLFPKHVVEQPEPEIARTGELPALRESSVNKPELSKPEVATVPQGPTIDIDTFAQAELRVGRVLQVDAVPKSHKLLKLLIDLGEGTPRQILSGIAETVAPADLLGRQVLVIANLPPRKLMGHDSHGMLLVAEDAEGKRVPLHPGRDVPNGSGVK
jgi:methionyl-tRNA synthetase